MEFASPESLPSEEWISQPRSSAPASIHGDSPGPISSVDRKSQSRIPRPASFSASHSSVRIEAFQSSTAMDVQYPARKILSEKTLSELNICRPEDALNVTNLPKGREKSHHSQLTLRRSSTVSPGGSQKGTVQQKPRQITSSGQTSLEETPDWKRRMLNNGNERTQQDLFSPIGLEHVFKPLTDHRKTRKAYESKSKNSGLRTDTNFPSSLPSCQTILPGDSLTLSRTPAVRAVKVDVMPFRQSSFQPSPQSKNIPPSREKSVHCTQSTQAFGKRIESSQSDARHERISPVQMALVKRLASPPKDGLKHSISKGKPRSTSRSSDIGIDYRNLSSAQAAEQDDSLPDSTVQSLPGNLRAGIDSPPPVSKYVNIHRGDHYIDLSFQRRSLSPSSDQHLRATSPDIKNDWDCKDSGTNSSIRRSTRRKVVSDAPTTPGKVVEPHNAPEGPRSSGSPLKLFDKHDTFTNNRLARRISQFEGLVGNSHSAQDLNNNIPLDSPLERKDSWVRCPDIKRRRSLDIESAKDIQHFGDGILDSYNFRRPCATKFQSAKGEQGMDASSSDLKCNAANRSEAHDYMSFERHTRSKPAGRVSTEFPTGVRPSTLGNESMEVLQRRGNLSEACTKEHNDNKRSLVSPVRKPESKRRRTINSGAAMPNVLKSGLAYSQDFTGRPTHSRKRKDARYEERSQVMDSGVLKTRHILRPQRKTTFTQQSTSKSVRQDGGLNAIPGAQMHGDRQNHPNASTSTNHTPVAAVARQLADFALEVADDAANGDRKVSVTTADFTNAANLIMQNIRAQARPRLGRVESENTDPVQLNVIDEVCHEGSTVEILSRPPSREGRALENPRKFKQLDPRVISHLRKYEEKDDLCMSTSLPNSFGAADRDGHSATSSSHSGITDSRSIHEGGNRKANSVDSARIRSSNSINRPGDFCSSLPSSQSSAGTSVPTESSSGSGNKAIIGPEKVSHLISDHVAGMTYDHTRQLWIKKKSITEDQEGIPDIGNNDITEEDPLKSIPDLSVDEFEEMRQIQPLNLNSQASSYKAPGESIIAVEALNSVNCNTAASSTGSITRRAASPSLLPGQSSSSPCFRHAPHDHQEKKELDLWRLESHQEAMYERPSSVRERDIQQDSDKHESVLKAQITNRSSCSTSHGPNKSVRQARVVTVAFSSPLASHILRSAAPPSGRISEETSEHRELDLMSSLGVTATLDGSRNTRKMSRSCRQQLNGRSQRGVSSHGHEYLIRSITRIDEHEELSIVHQPGIESSLELGATFSSPQASHNFRGASCPPSLARCQHSDAGSSLSPLSDFTLHQTDDRLSSNKAYSVTCQGLIDPHYAEESFPLVVQELVAKITDVEPYDPYWENIRKLDLKSKGLVTLLKLEDFCMRIEELDVSSNALTHLDGAPRTVRVMRAPRNCLSSLTGWGHLQNLQYLDVSDNHLDSLEGLNDLVHLRELKADNNHIKSLDGIARLNGLLRLRLRANDLVSLDLQASDL